jgi:predicted phage tail protein
MTVATLRQVRLYGVLGQKFGKVHYLSISTPAEAVRALCATIEGFKAFLLTQASYGYKIIVDRAMRLVEALGDPFGKTEVVKIVPIVGGAKKGGLGVILGAIIYAVSAYYGFTPGMQLGMGMMVGGVIQLLSPQRRGGGEAKTDNGAPNYAFDGPVNTTQQGLPVPLVYGRVITGSAVISAGLTVDDTSPPPPPPPVPPPPQILPPEQPVEPAGNGDGSGPGTGVGTGSDGDSAGDSTTA